VVTDDTKLWLTQNVAHPCPGRSAPTSPRQAGPSASWSRATRTGSSAWTTEVTSGVARLHGLAGH